YLPKKIRDKVQIEAGVILDVSVEDRKIILGPHKSIVRKSKGIFRTKKPIQDIDGLVEEATYEEVTKDL
ncbi:MAG: hypothetical protein ACE5HH_06010, partial [Candidatus Hydrothermarchaeales archaeon]